VLGQDAGGALANVIAPPTDAEGGLFSEMNDNSVGILLTHGAARVLLAGDAEAKSGEYMAGRTRARSRSSRFKSTQEVWDIEVVCHSDL
jgi:beta-lactamase superfamily II metal-dependent hydrolase